MFSESIIDNLFLEAVYAVVINICSHGLRSTADM